MTGLVICLCACGSASEQPQEPVEETNAVSEESLIEDFKEAQELWFRFEGGLENDYDDSVTGQIYGYDMDFYRVSEPGIGSSSG